MESVLDLAQLMLRGDRSTVISLDRGQIDGWESDDGAHVSQRLDATRKPPFQATISAKPLQYSRLKYSRLSPFSSRPSSRSL